MGLNLHGPIEQELERIQNEEEKKNADDFEESIKTMLKKGMKPMDIVRQFQRQGEVGRSELDVSEALLFIKEVAGDM